MLQPISGATTSASASQPASVRSLRPDRAGSRNRNIMSVI
jgi:hypothetical protein